MTTLFGDQLRQLREIRQRSASDLAKALNISAPYLCQIEYGVRPPLSLHGLLKAAKVLDLNDEQTVALALLAIRHPKGLRVRSEDFRAALPILKQLVDAFTPLEHHV